MALITPKTIFRALFTVALILGAGGCNVGEDVGVEEPQDQEERLADPSLVFENEEELTESSGELQLEAGYCPGCSNCVFRARCLQPRLPLNLEYWSQKVNRINSYTPRVGCVAMIYTGSQWGHAAYVADKHADGTITIREGNWIGNTCSSRRRTPANLNVRGYWCP